MQPRGERRANYSFAFYIITKDNNMPFPKQKKKMEVKSEKSITYLHFGFY